MPRDLRTRISRCRTLFISWIVMTIQASMSDDTPASVSLDSFLPELRLVKRPVTSFTFRSVDHAHQHRPDIVGRAHRQQVGYRIDDGYRRIEVAHIDAR
jgi:hypothetical protein